MFSATQTQELEKLVRAGLRNPVRIAVKEKGVAATATQKTPSRLSNYYTVSPLRLAWRTFSRCSVARDAALTLHSVVVSDLSGRGQVQQPGDVSQATQAREAAGLLQVYYNSARIFTTLVAFHVDKILSYR